MIFDGAATPDNWFSIALAALNVIQTIALAYLAAARRKDGTP